MNTELVTKLRTFGLNSYESKLWLGLLSNGLSTAGELSTITNVPRSRCYDVLKSLKDKGFIFVKNGKPCKYGCYSPNEALDGTKKKIQKKISRQIVNLEKYKKNNSFFELKKVYLSGSNQMESEEYVCFLDEYDNILNWLIDHIEKSHSSVKIVETIEGISKNNKKLKEIFKKKASIGVKIQLLLNNPKNEKVNINGQVRQKNTQLNTRFYLIDDSYALIMFFKDNHACLITNSPQFVLTLSNSFNNHWKSIRKI